MDLDYSVVLQDAIVLAPDAQFCRRLGDRFKHAFASPHRDLHPTIRFFEVLVELLVLAVITTGLSRRFVNE